MKLYNRIQKNKALLSVIIILGFVIITSAITRLYLSRYSASGPTKNGISASGGIYAGEELGDSLDLSVAVKAMYQSAPLTKVKDFGIVDNTHQSAFSYKVEADGLTEYGLMTIPISKMPAGGYPVIILCHGYYKPSDYSTTSGYIGDMEEYSQHGFVVVKPDFRGQGMSANQGSPEGAYYSMAYNTDVMSLIAALKDTSYINKAKINMWGQSLGAYIALRATVLSTDIKNTILLSGPVGQIQDMYRLYTAASDADNPVALKIKDAAIRKYGNPITNPDYWENASPINFLSSTNSNIQIHVGLKDGIVPPVFSAQLDAALTKSGKPHQYFVYPNGTHNLKDQRSLIWQRSLDLLNK